MVRCVVFDFDGTLVRSNEIKRQAYFEVASSVPVGVPLMQKVLAQADGRDRYWVFETFAQASPAPADPSGLAQRYTQICQDRIAAAPEVEGARASLERLRQEGKLVFLNSATPAGPLARLARLRGLDGLLDGVYGAPARKHENLETIAALHDLAPLEMLVVGDGESDWASAEHVGCHFVAVENEYNDFTRQPACRIPDLKRLPEVISGFLGGDKMRPAAPAAT
jgi:phosphoglycolate phosphatase